MKINLRSPYNRLSLSLFVCLIVLVILTFPQYGIGWDEESHLENGNFLIEFYDHKLAGDRNWFERQEESVLMYGGFYDLVAAILRQASRVVFNIGEVEANHMITSLVGILGVVGVWATTYRLAGEKDAWWAALFLSITPVYYGHMYINPKDIPFAVGCIWSLYGLLGIVLDLPRMNWRKMAFFCLMAGLTMAIRVMGVYLLLLFTLALAWNMVDNLLRLKAAASEQILKGLILPVGLVCLGAYAIMLIFWPWAQSNPLTNPWLALMKFRSFPIALWVRFNGVFYHGAYLPRDYLPRLLAITLPELFLAALFGWLLRFREEHKFGNRIPLQSFSSRGAILLFLAVSLPLFYVIIARPVLYDGIRHFLFILPPLACLAGIGMQAIVDRICQISKVVQRAGLIVLCFYLVVHITSVARLHPYEYIFFNRFVGGLPGAYRDYETEYWGTAASQAARWLAKYLTQGGSVPFPEAAVVVCSDDLTVSYYLPPTIKITNHLNYADYLIGCIRFFGLEQFEGHRLYTVARDGVSLATVIALRQQDERSTTNVRSPLIADN